MSTVFWPGDEHAGERFTAAALIRAMGRTEAAWLDALIANEVAPAHLHGRVVADLCERPSASVLSEIAAGAEASGNPAVPLVSWLRARLREQDEDLATWLHRGLTSQDVVDTAMMLEARSCADAVLMQLDRQLDALITLLDHNAAAPMVARTLTQPAVPITFGARASTWLHGLLDAAEQLRALTFPAQFAGAAGTSSGAVALLAARPDPVGIAQALSADATARLDLVLSAPWHTVRAPLDRYVDALVACSTAWGHVANDVLIGSRAEIGELREGAGGGSSTMPQKANPVLSVLIRRAALTTPGYAAQVHLAAADMSDERAAGAWHAEWEPVALCSRHALTAATHATRLLIDLHVDTERMAANLANARPGVDAERHALHELVGAHGQSIDAGVVGTDTALVRAAVARAHAYRQGPR